MSPVPLLGSGVVRHRRLRPTPHAFAYASYFLMLPLRSLRAAPSRELVRNRFGLVSFHDRDHGDGRADCLAWLDELLAREGLVADGEVWLQCHARVLGHAFKPVSFWYCHRHNGTLVAIVVEVNNTFGERHCYLLAGDELAYGRELTARKVLHVSPFCAVEGRYRFRFLRSDADRRCVVRIEHDDAAGPLLVTSVSGRLAPLTRRNARAAFFAMPLAGLGVLARIHWQALQLWLKRTPWFAKPAPPEHTVTR
jgi:DUF1365 family protein